MRLVKCRKCGATITTDDTIAERMMDRIDELNALARKDPKNRTTYQQQASAVKKLMTQILHRTAALDEQNRRLIYEHKQLVHYVLDNGLVSKEKLIELDEIARVQATIADRNDEAEIRRLYGEFENITINRTKVDPTADQAFRRRHK